MNNSTDTTKDITEVLQDLMEKEHMNPDKLSEATDVPKRFIASLTNGDFDQLPARPYVRGYLFKIAEVLKTNPHRLWDVYRRSAEIAASGAKDRLPSNRFAATRVQPGWIVGGILAVLFIVFLGFRLDNILGKPTLSVSLPERTSEKFITISGKIAPGDRLTLNGEIIFPNESGEFKKEVQLVPGANLLKFRVERYLGRAAEYEYQVFYEPPPAPAEALEQGTQPAQPNSTTEATQ